MRHSALITAVIASLVLAACGDDENDTRAASATTTVAAAAGDADRYCALTRELDREGERFFASIGEDARPEEYEAAERRFITRFAGKLDELEQAAPREIDEDVDVLLAGQRARAGLTSGNVDEAKASAAEERIRAWEKRNCEA